MKDIINSINTNTKVKHIGDNIIDGLIFKKY